MIIKKLAESFCALYSSISDERNSQNRSPRQNCLTDYSSALYFSIFHEYNSQQKSWKKPSVVWTVFFIRVYAYDSFNFYFHFLNLFLSCPLGERRHDSRPWNKSVSDWALGYISLVGLKGGTRRAGITGGRVNTSRLEAVYTHSPWCIRASNSRRLRRPPTRPLPFSFSIPLPLYLKRCIIYTAVYHVSIV